MKAQSSIRRKIIGVVMLTSMAVLLVTVIAFVTHDLVRFRASIVQNISTLARAIADNSTAALAFRNEQDAREILSSLRAEPQVQAAVLFDQDGNVFATYPALVPRESLPANPGPAGHRFSRGYLELTEPVFQDSKRLGSLYLKTNLQYFYGGLTIYAWFSALIVLASLAVAFALSSWLQKRISDPLIALAGTARHISEKGDYSVRASTASHDELGLLTEAFNQMLTRIQDQNIALQQGEERLRLALEASRIGTWDWDLVTGRISWDDHNALLFGIEPGKFDGAFSQVLAMVHPSDQEEVRQRTLAAIEQKTDFIAEYRVLWPDGSMHNVVSRGKAFFDAQGKPLRMTGVTQDITQRRKAEEARAFLAAIVDSTEDAIIGKDLSGTVVSWNPAAERMFGYTAAEMVGRSILRIISPDRPEEEHRILTKARAGITQVYDTVRIRKDGKPLHISLTVSPIRGPSGDIVGVSSISRDIAERIRNQEALERQSRVLREQAQMLDLANVMARDLTGRIILWNTGMEKMYGWAREEMLGRRSHQVLQTRFPQPLDEITATLVREGQWEGELVHTRKDGNPLTVASLWVLHRDHEGHPSAILEINTDITARKQAERELLQLNTELERRVQERTAELMTANNELEAFTYSVAHDLRAPLRHIDAFTRILIEEFSTDLHPEARRHLDIIRKGSQNMSQLVDDLLNLARVGRQELRFQSIPLDPLVQEVIADMRREVEHRRINWRIEHLPTAQGDPGLLKQIFANLLSNAVKYTRPRPQATIQIGCRQLNGECVIFVNDNGVGFNMKYSDKLFGVFQRLHRADEFEGTGVGLAIVQRVVRRHGGRVWAESNLGQGATFYFTLHGLAGENKPA